MANSTINPPTQRVTVSKQIPETISMKNQGGESLMRLPSALAKDHEIKEHLNTKGAQADIFLVEHKTSRDKSIVKLYRKGFECNADLLKRLPMLASRHVVKTFHCGESDSCWFEQMEYLSNGNLYEYLKESPTHSDDFHHDVLIELHEGLKYLHSQGIFHRDLKPENILIRESSPLKLALSDFGIASVSETSIRFTQGGGTSRYSAPEQMTTAATVTGKTDYYSLGMIIFEILIGRHPLGEDLGDYAISLFYVTGRTSTGSVLPFECIEQPRWRQLCQGLIIRNPEERWGSDEVNRWLLGDETLTVLVERQNASNIPYAFNGKEYYKIEDLACALASDWNKAIKDYYRGYLSSWFSGALFNQELARKADDLLEDDDISSDEKIFRLLLIMAPKIPNYWKGVAINENGLRSLAEQVAEKNDEAVQKINEIFNDEYKIQTSLNKYKFYNNPILAQLKQDIILFEKKWSEISSIYNIQHLKPNRSIILAFFILANTDREREKVMRHEICCSLSQDIRKYSLLKILGDPENNDIHSLALLSVLKDYIIDDYNKYVAKIKRDIINEIKSNRNILNKEVDRIRSDFPETIATNPKLKDKIHKIMLLINNVEFDSQSICSLERENNRLLRLQKFIFRVRTIVVNKFPGKESLYILLRKLVVEYGDSLFINDEVKAKFQYIQQSEEDGTKEDIALSFEYIRFIENHFNKVPCESDKYNYAEVLPKICPKSAYRNITRTFLVTLILKIKKLFLF